MVIKKDADPSDEETLQNHILEVKQKWSQEWTFQFEKIRLFKSVIGVIEMLFRNLPPSEARAEALKRIDNWTAPKLPNFSLLHFEDTDLPRLIASAFDLRYGLRIRDGFPPRPTLFSKPPVILNYKG